MKKTGGAGYDLIIKLPHVKYRPDPPLPLEIGF